MNLPAIEIIFFIANAIAIAVVLFVVFRLIVRVGNGKSDEWIGGLPILNDFWFFSGKDDTKPFDPDVDQRCRSRYRREWFMHPLLWMAAFLLWWPLGVLVLLVYLIRRTKNAYYNHTLYEAESEGKRFVPPSDSRLALYGTAIVIVFVGYWAYQLSRMLFDQLSLMIGQ